MDIISKILYGNNNNIEKRNVLWNMLGSLIYAMTSMSIGIIASRLIGAELGGIFFFAFATLGQQLYTLAYFGIRPIQITDMAYRYSFGDYRGLRFITSAIAILLGVLYTIFKARTRIEFIIYILMILYKVLDAVADCYESEWQRKGRLYIAGKSLALRTLISLFVFIVVISISKNLIFAGIAFVLSLVFCIYLFAISPLMNTKPVISVSKAKIKELFSDSKWLFISTFLDLYIFAASKFALNSVMGGIYNSYYSTIFIPTSIINLMAGFVIRPTLSKMSQYYEENDKKSFKNTVLKIMAFILIFTLLALLLVLMLGRIALSILLVGIKKEELASYNLILALVILGGGFYALMNLMYYVLVIFKKEKQIFTVYLLASIVAFYTSEYAVKKLAMFGAAISYVLLMFSLAFIFYFLSYRCIKELKG